VCNDAADGIAGMTAEEATETCLLGLDTYQGILLNLMVLG